MRTYTESELEQAYTAGLQDGRAHALGELAHATEAIIQTRAVPPSDQPTTPYYCFNRWLQLHLHTREEEQ